MPMFQFFQKMKEPAILADPLAWQRCWHEILDDYEHPEESETDKGVPDPLPEMSSDFRLQFHFWYVNWPAGIKARRRAFAILPRGKAMLARVEKHLSSRSVAIEPEAAITLLRQGLSLTRQLGFETADPSQHIRIMGENDLPLLEAFAAANSPFIYLRDNLSDLILRECAQTGRDAYFFLDEPLYQLSTSYDVANWILWPLCAPLGTTDPTEAAYRLYEGGWSAGWDRQGLFLFDRRKEFRLL